MRAQASAGDLAPRILGLASFALFAWAAPAGPYWLDSQELGAAAVRMGVPHPTGFPLFVLLGRVASLAPIGELAWRVHLLSALCGAIAVAQVARLVVEQGGEDVAALCGAIGAAVVLAMGLTFFRNATVTEVYAPAAAAVAIALRLAVRLTRGAGGRAAGLALAFFSGACAAGMHVSFALLLGVPLLALFVWRLRRGARWAIWTPACAAVGWLGMALFLPLRSASGHVGALDWGHTSTWSGFWRHVSAGRIRDAYEGRMFDGVDALAAASSRALDDLGVLALLVGAAGVWALAARRRTWPAALLLVAVALGDLAYAAWINPMGIHDRQVGVPMAVALAVLGGLGVAAAARRLGRVAPFAAAVIAVAISVEPSASGWAARLGATRTEGPRAWAEAALARCPTGGVLLVQNDDLAANLFWLGLVERARPDLAVVVRQHAGDVRRNQSVLGARAGSVEDVLALGRPVCWELGVDQIPGGWRAAIDLPVARLGRSPEELGDAPAAPSAAVVFMRRLFTGPIIDDENARRLATRSWVNLGAMLSASDTAGAALATEQAVALAPDHAVARLNAARYRLAMNDDAAALAHATAAARLAPERAAAWALLGTLDARAGRCAEAIRHLERALTLDPTDHDASVNLPRARAMCALR